MAPESALRQRLSQGSIYRNEISQSQTQTDTSSSDNEIHFQDAGPFGGPRRGHTPRSTIPPSTSLNVSLQVTDETNIPKRSISTEMIRRRRELQLQRTSSSDIDPQPELPSIPPASLRRRRSKTPNKMSEAEERDKSPAPIARGIEKVPLTVSRFSEFCFLGESEDSPAEQYSARRSFLPSFILEPLRKLFSRPVK